MTRNLWNELGPKWPQEHWDHWLRQPKQHQGREVVIPSMPRVYHNGIKGTFMDKKTHNQYFARIATNRVSKKNHFFIFFQIFKYLTVTNIFYFFSFKYFSRTNLYNGIYLGITVVKVRV